MLMLASSGCPKFLGEVLLYKYRFWLAYSNKYIMKEQSVLWRRDLFEDNLNECRLFSLVNAARLSTQNSYK